MEVRRSLAVIVVLGLAATGYVGLTPALGSDGPPPRAHAPQGPWLDEIVWTEEGDPTQGLDDVIAGTRDVLTYAIRTAADQDRAIGSTRVNAFAAHPIYDELSLNPAERQPMYPRNPFALREVREGLQFLINRTYIVETIFEGRALPMQTLWHPTSSDFERSRSDLSLIESMYPYDPVLGEQQVTAALLAAGWSTVGGQWNDPEGRLVTVKLLERIQDERLQMGAYYGQILRGIGFDVQEIGVTNLGIPFGSDPSSDAWNLYTAAWMSTLNLPWDDEALLFFAACGFGEPYCTPGGSFYDPPDELETIASTLAFGQYMTLGERQNLIARGTELAMQESIRIFIETRRQLFVNNARMQDVVFERVGGPVNAWALKAATVPPDPFSGLRTANATNLLLYFDGWNPWVSPGWLYDRVQRDAIVDPGMGRHPRTGVWTDFRTNAIVQTAGPSGVLPVPSDAIVFDTGTMSWTMVGGGTTAISKVTLDMVFGRWHHGEDITMDDVLYTWSNLWRRVQGDIGTVPGISTAASPAETFLVQNQLRAIRPVDGDTLEVYIDYWHVDDQEIAGLAAAFPSAPWEVQEIGAKLILDQIAANDDADASLTGRIWLDLTKGDSLPHLGEALAAYEATNHVPPGMAGSGLGQIDATEAATRWTSLTTWNATYGPGSGGPTYFGHFWPSNGPFFLERVDPILRQTIMKAFRSGYPFDADKWRFLSQTPIPDLSTSVGGQAKVTAGSVLTIVVDVRNVGNAASSGVNLTAYQGSPPVPFHTAAIPPIGAGGVYIAFIPWTAPASRALVDMVFVVDPEGALAEGDEANNDAAVIVDVRNPPTTSISWQGPNATMPQLYVTTATTFTLAATDDSGDGLATYYRIDGGAPVAYGGGFSLSPEGSRTIEYWSEDNLGGIESPNELSAVVDDTPSAATISLLGPSVNANRLYVAASTMFALAATDGGSGVQEVRYRIDGGTAQAFGAPFSLAVEGAHQLEYWSTDRLGNAEPSSTLDAYLDLTPPTTDLAWDGPNATRTRLYVTPDTMFSLSGDDVGSGLGDTWYRIDGGAATRYTGPFVISSEGDHTLAFWGVDLVGNTEGESSREVTVDATPPVTGITVGAPSDGGVTVALDAQDASAGVAYVEYRIDDGAWLRYSAPFSVTGVGVYTVEYRAVDRLNNTETVQSREVTIPAPEGPGGAAIPPEVLIAAVVVVAALFGAVLVLWRRKKRKNPAEPATPPQRP